MATPEQTTAAPATAPTPASKQPMIFTMPEKYRGGAQPMAAPKAPVPPPAPMPMAAPVPVAPKPVAPKAPSGKPVPKKKSNLPKVLAIVGLLLVAALAVGAYFLVRTPAPVNTVPEPLPIPTPEPTPTPTPTPEPTPTGPTPGVDTDADGLTDIEEQMIYSSNPAVADTDQDGYPDALEVANFYNPAAIAPKTLFEAGVVRAHVFGPISFLYPSTWTFTDTPDGPVVFQVPTGETVTFRSVQSGEGPAADATAFVTKNGLQAYRPAKEGDPYFIGIPSGDLAVFKTDLGLKTTIDYGNTIDMMVNSVMLKK